MDGIKQFVFNFFVGIVLPLVCCTSCIDKCSKVDNYVNLTAVYTVQPDGDVISLNDSLLFKGSYNNYLYDTLRQEYVNIDDFTLDLYFVVNRITRPISLGEQRVGADKFSINVLRGDKLDFDMLRPEKTVTDSLHFLASWHPLDTGLYEILILHDLNSGPVGNRSLTAGYNVFYENEDGCEFYGEIGFQPFTYYAPNDHLNNFPMYWNSPYYDTASFYNELYDYNYRRIANYKYLSSYFIYVSP